KFSKQFLVFDVGKCFWHIFLKKTHYAGQLLDRDFGIDMRWVLKVLFSRCQKCRHFVLAIDQGLQPLLWRRKLPRHDYKGALCQAARVVVRVLSPPTYVLQFEKSGFEIVYEELVILPFLRGQRIGIERIKASQVF